MAAGATTSAARRVNVNFSSAVYEALTRLAERKGVSMSEALRRAIALDDYISAEQEQGARLLLERGDQVTELLIR
jgi:metal-responsive CopG/Arc/MetJ family transcriptional regulator